MDFPGVCMSCVDEQCNVVAPDLAAVRERVGKVPEGYTRTLLKNLQYAMPEVDNDEKAYLIFDIFKATIANGLKNKDVVFLEGLGEFRTEPRDGRVSVVFTPEKVLDSVVNE
jgi:nucleoid DNA-binding protein